MKKTIAVLALISVLGLTACSSGESAVSESSSQESTETVVSDNSSSGTSSDISETSESDSSEISDSSSNDSTAEEASATFLRGLAGDTIYTSDFEEIFSENGEEIAPEDFSEENFSAVLCNGFTYLAEPSGTCRTNFDNADVYDSATASFTDYPVEKIQNYKRFNQGDTICGLTVSSAQTNFAKHAGNNEYTLSDGTTKIGTELGYPEIYFLGSSVSFSGEITLTGYIRTVPEDEYGVFVGDILFLPSGEDANLPVMGYEFSADSGFFHSPRQIMYGDIAAQNEYGYIKLGNISETSADISAVPTDGSFIKAKVTVSNVQMSCSVGWVNNISAEILNIEKL